MSKYSTKGREIYPFKWQTIAVNWPILNNKECLFKYVQDITFFRIQHVIFMDYSERGLVWQSKSLMNKMQRCNIFKDAIFSYFSLFGHLISFWNVIVHILLSTRFRNRFPNIVIQFFNNGDLQDWEKVHEVWAKLQISPRLTFCSRRTLLLIDGSF